LPDIIFGELPLQLSIDVADLLSHVFEVLMKSLEDSDKPRLQCVNAEKLGCRAAHLARRARLEATSSM
jgi:hypothetical protein